jgi:hypothetical protein
MPPIATPCTAPYLGLVDLEILVSKLEDLNSRAGFNEELESVGRAVAVAIAGAKPSAANPQGSIDIEVSLSALMLMAAGLIAKDPNLKTRRDVRLQAEEFGKMLREMAVSDRDAGDAGERQFLDLLGAGISPGKNTHMAN